MNDLVQVEGKTKIVIPQGRDGTCALIESKDDLTAGNGKRHEVALGKGRLANTTTCNVFRFLGQEGLPLAFVQRVSPTAFLALNCRMIPLEVVVRGVAAGSYLKRFPTTEKGAPLPDLPVEFYLKTSGREWRGKELPCDDPLLLPDERDAQYLLYEPDKPTAARQPCLALDAEELFAVPEDADFLPEMAEHAMVAFAALRAAWGRIGFQLVDFKVEFGVTPNGDLVIADVIDNDSWRLLRHGQHVDKQLFRDGESIEEVMRAYRLVADMSIYLPDAI